MNNGSAVGALEGRVALITGGSRGIGLGIAKKLVSLGARVCVTARREPDLTAAIAELGGPEWALGVLGSSDNEEHQVAAVTSAMTAFGRIDMLVNNAGINPVHGPLANLEPGAARKVFEVNALAPLLWSQKVHQVWMAEHGGSIVNILSSAALRPYPGIGFYGATKAMLAHLTQGMAIEMGPAVRVNAISPGIIKTSFAEALYAGREQELAEAYPMLRLGAPDDVAGAAAFLLGDEASWITGSVIVVDGGSGIADSWAAVERISRKGVESA